MYIYLAGRIEGLAIGDAKDWRDQVMMALDGHKVYNPVDPSEYLPGWEEGLITSSIVRNPKELVLRDFHNLMRSDLVLVKLDDEPSIGTLIELGMAHAFQITIVGWGEGKIQKHPFIQEVVKVRFQDLLDAVSFINCLEG